MKRLLPILGLLALAACATTPKGPTVPDPRTAMPALETRIAELVQAQRHIMDPAAKPLAVDLELAKVARARAADMAAKRYLAHAGPDGATSASLLMKDDAKWQGLLGENLAAQHYNRQTGVPVDAFARAFLDEWLKSPPHRENMAYAAYDHAGVGAAVNGDTVYVALLFSTDMGLPPPPADGPASTVTRFDSARAAQTAPDPARPDPIRLRGTQGNQ